MSTYSQRAKRPCVTSVSWLNVVFRAVSAEIRRFRDRSVPNASGSAGLAGGLLRSSLPGRCLLRRSLLGGRLPGRLLPRLLARGLLRDGVVAAFAARTLHRLD